MPYMAHYTHHLDRIGTHGWNPEAFPDSLAFAEGVLS